MYALTSIVCSIMVAASPAIEDAPSHRLTAFTSSAMPEELGEAISPSVVESIDAPQTAQEMSELELTAQGVEVEAPLQTASAPKLETLLELKKTDLPLQPPLEIADVPAPVAPVVEKTVAEAVTTPALEAPVAKEAQINLAEVFSGAPLIYSLLLLMSLFALTIWIYHLFLMRKEQLMPESFAHTIESRLAVGNWQEALALCRKNENLLAILVRASIAARHEGSQAMIERMQAEGKRATSFFWQRLSLLNDIALIAPMVGLLGTVLGMFYAFYDVNRSLESMYTLFDGLGISVGTTVGGLVVAIMALIFHSTLKYRLVRQLSLVDERAQKIALHPSARQPNAQLRETHELST